jgi:hypothetical protein
MSRRNRFLTALLSAAALLFSQLAVSAYACPMAMAPDASMQADCDEAGADVILCERHCDYGNASFDAAKPLKVPAVAVFATLRVELPEACSPAIAAPSSRIAAGPAPPPPLARFTVLRI